MYPAPSSTAALCHFLDIDDGMVPGLHSKFTSLFHLTSKHEDSFRELKEKLSFFRVLFKVQTLVLIRRLESSRVIEFFPHQLHTEESDSTTQHFTRSKWLSKGQCSYRPTKVDIYCFRMGVIHQRDPFYCGIWPSSPITSASEETQRCQLWALDSSRLTLTFFDSSKRNYYTWCIVLGFPS